MLYKLSLVDHDHKIWSDWKQATSYWDEIRKNCETEYVESGSKDCYKEGNRWSVLYALNMATMYLLAANAALMILGAWNLNARGLSACCASLLCCLSLAAIITTGVFRFNSWGQLSALCLAPTKYEGMTDDNTDVKDFSSSHTYQSDAKVILALWICQMIFCCTSCAHLIFVAKKPAAPLDVDYSDSETDSDETGSSCSSSGSSED